MGYRSDGVIWLPEETYKQLPDTLKQDLKDNWEQDENDKEIYRFYDWKWYSGYDDVDAWNQFHSMCLAEDMDIDFIIIGEDNAILIEPSGHKLGYSFNIEVY